MRLLREHERVIGCELIIIRASSGARPTVGEEFAWVARPIAKGLLKRPSADLLGESVRLVTLHLVLGRQIGEEDRRRGRRLIGSTDCVEVRVRIGVRSALASAGAAVATAGAGNSGIEASKEL